MNPRRSALFTDLYELTMGEAYLAEGMSEDAGFELFFRKLPEPWRRIDHTEWEYPVHVSPALEDDLARLTEKLTCRRPSPLEVNGLRAAPSRG